jgi:benzoyl-CoA 2,3-dioxygenase component B
VNVEEGRHLWAMVYLLHSYFGRDGREEAEGLLERRSGDPDKPRILGAFNEKTARLAVVLHVHVLHRPRREVPARSRWPRAGFDPLARTTRFMLTEEAHHMFVGETGIARILSAPKAGGS